MWHASDVGLLDDKGNYLIEFELLVDQPDVEIWTYAKNAIWLYEIKKLEKVGGKFFGTEKILYYIK